jgi:hypothetical protein
MIKCPFINPLQTKRIGKQPNKILGGLKICIEEANQFKNEK